MKFTFPSHPHFEALLQPTVLALVPMVLINRAASAAAAGVVQVSADRPLEERLAAWKKMEALC